MKHLEVAAEASRWQVITELREVAALLLKVVQGLQDKVIGVALVNMRELVLAVVVRVAQVGIRLTSMLQDRVD